MAPTSPAESTQPLSRVQAEVRLACGQGLRVLQMALEPGAAPGGAADEKSCRVLHEVVQLDEEDEALAGALRQKDDCYCSCTQVLPQTCANLSFGSLVVHWHRIGAAGGAGGGVDDGRRRFGVVVTRIPLPPVAVSVAALTMSLDTPAQVRRAARLGLGLVGSADKSEAPKPSTSVSVMSLSYGSP